MASWHNDTRVTIALFVVGFVALFGLTALLRPEEGTFQSPLAGQAYHDDAEGDCKNSGGTWDGGSSSTGSCTWRSSSCGGIRRIAGLCYRVVTMYDGGDATQTCASGGSLGMGINCQYY
jgi:hypothetical protein